MAIKVGIFGYGNLGRGVEQAIRHNPDMELVGVFTRRDPAGFKIKTPGVKVYGEDALIKQEVPMDVLILCGGSATDLPVQGPKYAALYNIIPCSRQVAIHSSVYTCSTRFCIHLKPLGSLTFDGL